RYSARAEPHLLWSYVRYADYVDRFLLACRRGRNSAYRQLLLRDGRDGTSAHRSVRYTRAVYLPVDCFRSDWNGPDGKAVAPSTSPVFLTCSQMWPGQTPGRIVRATRKFRGA